MSRSSFTQFCSPHAESDVMIKFSTTILFLMLMVISGLPMHGQDLPEARSVGSPEVSLDSWVYPAFDRLAGTGLIHTQFFGLRPWTRFSCAPLAREAKDSLPTSESETFDAQLVARLGLEFNREIEVLDEGSIKQVQVDSVYSRVTGIAGTPLNDSFHFGQTVINDYGRPYASGLSNVFGFSASGQVGALFGTFRGEYQHAA